MFELSIRILYKLKWDFPERDHNHLGRLSCNDLIHFLLLAGAVELKDTHLGLLGKLHLTPIICLPSGWKGDPVCPDLSLFILMSSRILETNRAKWEQNLASFYFTVTLTVLIKIKFPKPMRAGGRWVQVTMVCGKPGDVTGQAGEARAGVGVGGTSPCGGPVLAAAGPGSRPPHWDRLFSVSAWLDCDDQMRGEEQVEGHLGGSVG